MTFMERIPRNLLMLLAAAMLIIMPVYAQVGAPTAQGTVLGSPTAGSSVQAQASANASVSVSSAATGIQSKLCSILNILRSVVAIIALALFLLGAIIYGGAHFLPSAGNIRSSAQAWGMGMVVGAAVGLILFILAPYIISLVISVGNASGYIPMPNC